MKTRTAATLLLALAVLASSLPGQSTTGRSDSSSAVRVWVNSSSHVYHCPGSRYYGNTKSGEFMSEAEARESGNRPAYGRPCAPAQRRAVADAGVSVRVWVNTGSGVYHCPGSRYYGGTREGKYMTEAEARSGGFRPAYNRACS